ncbi:MULTISPECIES: hypothetical protein [Salipiger]|jgi:hypothetical protein|uniref:Lipoprotein, putative n=1 Tax=Salipiger profundus TaxID=1229727 RepID=A0A1U7D062_9RHOB|nr:MULTISPECIES: hypothetical protein [Salipiger]APX21498.1 lipoprotein, putative [Salipiger profundus]GGA01921.1 hypothetical protein GCM10011326_11550 [Salipiger profundus]SFC18323.1 hypothetical protein SAMN05444415_102311 [Salipiger profundus]
MRGISGMGRGLLLAVPLMLSACFYGTEGQLRGKLSDTLYLRDTLYFRDRLGCTAALFSIYTRHPRPRVMRAGDVAAALSLLDRGKPVAFETGLSPDGISRAVLEHETRSGLGIVSAGVSGATQCLEPALEEPLYRAMLDPQVVTVYDPQAKVLALIEWSEKRAWVLRSFD